jgi:hypothetical protein
VGTEGKATGGPWLDESVAVLQRRREERLVHQDRRAGYHFLNLRSRAKMWTETGTKMKTQRMA